MTISEARATYVKLEVEYEQTLAEARFPSNSLVAACTRAHNILEALIIEQEKQNAER